MDYFLSARRIYKIYNHRLRRLEILKDINLDIAGKETVAIVGPSGAGKSTLLHILGGL
ncbi:MAG: ATP-binding cassette domain-containing protein, partial [Candidatus Omnitrophota bacterium]